jgi:hypothetical protein
VDYQTGETPMNRSNLLLWFLVFAFAALIYWLIVTGRLEAMANLFVDGYWKFVQSIPHFRR